MDKLRMQYTQLGAAEAPATLEALSAQLADGAQQAEEVLAQRRQLMETCSAYHASRAQAEARLDTLRKNFDKLHGAKDLALEAREAQLKVSGALCC